MAAYLGDTDSEDEIPPGWEERVHSDGRVYYANHASHSTQWSHPKTGRKKNVPKELPFGWRKEEDDEGSPIFIQDSTGKKTRTDPRLAFARETKEFLYDFKQRFDASSTAFQVLNGVDLTNKRALVTGGSGGIGLETAKSLAKHGCEIILACRNQKKARLALESIKSLKPTAIVEVVNLELESLQNVKDCANEILIKYRSLDFLVCNAATFGAPFALTQDNYERTFQVNFLSQFYLILLLKPLLVATSSSRILILSSESHRFSLLSPTTLSDDQLSPPTAKNFYSFMAYNDSKLCNAVMASEIDRRWSKAGITCNSVHPGNLVYTDISRHWCGYKILYFLCRPFTKSLQQAAATTIWGLVADELQGVSGQYLNNCWLCTPSNLVANPEMGEALWKVSVDMISRVMGNIPT